MHYSEARARDRQQPVVDRQLEVWFVALSVFDINSQRNIRPPQTAMLIESFHSIHNVVHLGVVQTSYYTEINSL